MFTLVCTYSPVLRDPCAAAARRAWQLDGGPCLLPPLVKVAPVVDAVLVDQGASKGPDGGKHKVHLEQPLLSLVAQVLRLQDPLQDVDKRLRPQEGGGRRSAAPHRKCLCTAKAVTCLVIYTVATVPASYLAVQQVARLTVMKFIVPRGVM